MSIYTSVLLAICLLFGGTKTAFGQQIPCPPNVDFEFGSFYLWQCRVSGPSGTFPGGVQTGPAGGSSVINQWTTVLPIAGRHSIMSGTGVDPLGNFPVVAPGGGSYSLRLGDQQTNNGAENVRYYLHVPVGVNNYSFKFNYAVVFEDPGHSSNEQPRFSVEVTDSATGQSLKSGCYDLNFVAGGGLPGFLTAPSNPGVLYKPWATGILNVSGSAGQTVIVDVISADCSLGGHWGYGYFDVVDCGRFQTAVASCDLDGSGIILTGPTGYMTYEWWHQDFSDTVATGQVATIHPNNVIPEYYNLVLTPFPSVSTCNDTIHTLPIANVDVQAQPDTSCITPGIPIQLDANAQGGVGGLTYEWKEFGTPGNTLSCYNCQAPVATPVGSSFYTVKVTDTNNCYRTDTLQVLYSVFKPDAGSSFTTCVGTPVTFNASVTPQSSAFTYKWTPNTDLNYDTLLNPIFTPTTAGTQIYTLTVDSLACSKTDTMSVTVLPNDFFITDTTICDGVIVKVNSKGDSAFTYSWSPTIGLSDPTIVDPIVTTDTSRTYTVTASYPTCPDIVKTYTVSVEPTPKLDLGADTSKCQFEDLFLVSHVTPNWYPNYTYQWDPSPNISSLNTPNVMYTGQVSDTLVLTVRTPVGCKDSESIRITVHPGNFAAITPTDTAICPNGAVGLNITGGQHFTWSPTTFIDDTTKGNVISTPISDIDYTIYVKDSFGCSDTVQASIVVHADAVLDLGPDVTIYPGDTVQMNPQGNCLYFQWFPPQGLSQTNIANPYASPLVNTRYYVTGSTEYGCVTKDSINVFVNPESVLEMPNAFSPGSSGPNNTLKLVRKGSATLQSLRIYDRWGTMVFETKNIDEGWDGKYKGTPQPMGVYVYTVEAETNTHRKFTKQGNVTLMR